MDPIFIFGTGRCGSTHLQRLISLETGVWIWGEHDGFLAPMFEMLRHFENSPPLQRTVFANGLPSDEKLVSTMRNDEGGLSWLNRLEPGDARRELAYFIDRLFRQRLPSGWERWGFKEILYGFGNRAPEGLLDLFPRSQSAFTFREPIETVESMVRAWASGLFLSELDDQRLTAEYELRVKRWRSIMTYFLALKPRAGDRLRFVPLQSFVQDPDRAVRLLGLARAANANAWKIGRTNATVGPVPPAHRARLDELRAVHEPGLRALYDQAVSIGAGEQ